MYITVYLSVIELKSHGTLRYILTFVVLGIKFNSEILSILYAFIVNFVICGCRNFTTSSVILYILRSNILIFLVISNNGLLKPDHDSCNSTTDSGNMIGDERVPVVYVSLVRLLGALANKLLTDCAL